MVRFSFLFLVLALAGALPALSLFAPNAATSVVPGWHTTIYSPGVVLQVVLVIWICLLPIFYFILEKRKLLLKKRDVMIHLFCTMLFFSPTSDLSTWELFFSKEVLLGSFGLFALGQLWFIVIIVRKIVKR